VGIHAKDKTGSAPGFAESSSDAGNDLLVGNVMIVAVLPSINGSTGSVDKGVYRVFLVRTAQVARLGVVGVKHKAAAAEAASHETYEPQECLQRPPDFAGARPDQKVRA
jgi:hypothetical protein